MAVVVRPRPVTVVIGVAGAVVAGILLGLEDGRLVREWLAPVLVVVWIGAVVRSRVEVGSDRVRIVRPVGGDEVLRHEVIAVHVGGGRRRPAQVSATAGPLDPGGQRRFVLPGLIGPARVARALDVPLRSFVGDRDVAPERVEIGTPWVAVLAVLLALAAVGMAVGFTIWG